jgi:hypothetical protein
LVHHLPPDVITHILIIYTRFNECISRLRQDAKLLFYLRFRPSGAGGIGRFTAFTVFTGHLIIMNNPIVGSTGALFTSPSTGFNIFFIPGCLEWTLSHVRLL